MERSNGGLKSSKPITMHITNTSVERVRARAPRVLRSTSQPPHIEALPAADSRHLSSRILVGEGPPHPEFAGTADNGKPRHVRVLLRGEVGPVPEELEGPERDLDQAPEVGRAGHGHR